MKPITNLLGLFFMVSLLIVFSSCETSKVAYGNSYYFKATPKTNPVSEAAAVATAPEADRLEVSISTGSEVPGDLGQRIKRLEEKTVKMEAARQKPEDARASTAELSRSEQKALAKEEKAQRKALKKEVRSLVKEYKHAPEKLEEQARVSGNTRTGIILGAVGLVLVLVGGPTILYTIGAILLVIGLVLILLDVL